MRDAFLIAAMIAIMLGGCGASIKPESELAQQNKTPMIYIEPDPDVRVPKGIKIEQLVRLDGRN